MKLMNMTPERAAEILDPDHREHYDSIEPVNEACRMGMGALKYPLLEFIRQEVPYRFEGIFGVPDVGSIPETVEDAVKELWDNCDEILNYDKIDEILTEVLRERGIEVNEE